MTLESTDYIAGLSQADPKPEDKKNQGDDHLRLIKHVLKYQFPGTGGEGYAEVITASESDLNFTTGLTSNAQEQFDTLGERVDLLEASLPAPPGTAMVFYNAAPPDGWTQDTTDTDYMMRIVSVSGGGPIAGTDSPILMDKVPSHTHTTLEAGLHNHVYTALFQTGGAGNVPGGGFVGWSTGNTEDEGTHTHEVDVNPDAVNWEPKYIDMVLGIKD